MKIISTHTSYVEIKGVTIKVTGITVESQRHFYLKHRQDWIFDEKGNPIRLKRKYGKLNRQRSQDDYNFYFKN